VEEYKTVAYVSTSIIATRGLKAIVYEAVARRVKSKVAMSKKNRDTNDTSLLNITNVVIIRILTVGAGCIRSI
jgi:hypothetical protein